MVARAVITAVADKDRVALIAFVGAHHIVRNCHAYGIITAQIAVATVREIIFTLVLHDHRALGDNAVDTLPRSLLSVDQAPCRLQLDVAHIGCHLRNPYHVAGRKSHPEHIRRAVIVDKYRRVDAVLIKIGTLLALHEGAARRIRLGITDMLLGTVCHQIASIGNLVDLGRPEIKVSPHIILVQGQRIAGIAAAVAPVLKVARAIDHDTVLGLRAVDIEPAVVLQNEGIGQHKLPLAGCALLLGQLSLHADSRHESCKEQYEFFHLRK